MIARVLERALVGGETMNIPFVQICIINSISFRFRRVAVLVGAARDPWCRWMRTQGSANATGQLIYSFLPLLLLPVEEQSAQPDNKSERRRNDEV